MLELKLGAAERQHSSPNDGNAPHVGIHDLDRQIPHNNGYY